MYIANTISKLIDCLFWPLFLYLITALVIQLIWIRKNRFELFIILFILLSWRVTIFLTASRYCSIFILYAFVAICFLYLNLKANPYLLKAQSVLVLIIVFVQTVKCFSGYRDIYVFDVKDELEHLSAKGDNSALLILDRELNRLSDGVGNKGFLIDSLENAPIILGADAVYEIMREEKKDTKTLFSVSINRRKTKRIYVLKRKQETSQLNLPYPDTNPIINGNIEKSYGNKLSGTMTRLIRDGANFYLSKDIKIPQHTILLPTTYYSGYPEVFADSTNAIDGSYSLNVKIYDIGTIYFFNMFKNSPGQLSFLIRGLDNRSELMLGRLDYDSNKKNLGLQFQKKIYLMDNNVHPVSLHFSKDQFAGSNSLFYLKSSNVHFLLDNICYITDR